MRLLGFDISRRERETPAHLVVQAEAERRAAERRAVTGPVKATSPDLATVIFGGTPVASGARVTEEGSLAVAAVYAAVRVLSESVASLPLKLYRRRGRAREVAPDHPLYRVLHDEGNDVMTAMKLREVMMVHMLLWGNCFCEIQRNGAGDVVALWPVHPARVGVKLTSVKGAPRLRYEIQTNGEPVTKLQEDILLVAGLGTGILGKSPIQLHREGLGISMQAERYGARFFANDARPGFMLVHPGVLGDEAYERLKTSWNERNQGADRSWRLEILEEGMEPKTVGLPPEDAQFIETRKYQRAEVASIYRVPPHMIGDLERATYSNIEHQGIEFVVHSLRPWLVRIEQAMALQLLTDEERAEYFASHVVDGLLRGDIKSRYDAYAIARNWGWMSADDVRELENLNPLPDGQGDVYLQPLNMVEAGTPPGRPAPTTGAGTDGQRGGGRWPRRELRASLPPRFSAAQALEPVFLDQFRRIVKRETVEIRRAAARYLPPGGTQDVAGFRTWLGTFEADQAQWMEPRVRPLFESMMEAMRSAAADEIGADVVAGDLTQFLVDYSEAYANRHAGASRGQLEALTERPDPAAAVEERLAEWDETRADREARRERQRSSNAFTKAAWALAGLSAVFWRNVGSETCPYCQGMDGRRTAITGFFLSAGDTVGGGDSPITVRTNVGHPPLHDGCDCILMPGFGARAALPAAELRTLFRDLITTGAPGDACETPHSHTCDHGD